MSRTTPGQWRPKVVSGQLVILSQEPGIEREVARITQNAPAELQWANAVLIAAAPLLLESAKMTLEIFEAGGLSEISPQAKRFEETMRAVIKKIDGDSLPPPTKGDGIQ